MATLMALSSRCTLWSYVSSHILTTKPSTNITPLNTNNYVLHTPGFQYLWPECLFSFNVKVIVTDIDFANIFPSLGYKQKRLVIWQKGKYSEAGHITSPIEKLVVKRHFETPCLNDDLFLLRAPKRGNFRATLHKQWPSNIKTYSVSNMCILLSFGGYRHI